MSKGLKALERLKDKVFPEPNLKWCLEIDAIEQELKDLDTIKEIFSLYGLEYKLTLVREALLLLKQYQGSHGVIGQALITKKLEALEIIKNTLPAFVYAITNSKDYQDYSSHYISPIITKEEYDLLKEVLL